MEVQGESSGTHRSVNTATNTDDVEFSQHNSSRVPGCGGEWSTSKLDLYKELEMRVCLSTTRALCPVRYNETQAILTIEMILTWSPLLEPPSCGPEQAGVSPRTTGPHEAHIASPSYQCNTAEPHHENQLHKNQYVGDPGDFGKP